MSHRRIIPTLNRISFDWSWPTVSAQMRDAFVAIGNIPGYPGRPTSFEGNGEPPNLPNGWQEYMWQSATLLPSGNNIIYWAYFNGDHIIYDTINKTPIISIPRNDAKDDYYPNYYDKYTHCCLLKNGEAIICGVNDYYKRYGYFKYVEGDSFITFVDFDQQQQNDWDRSEGNMILLHSDGQHIYRLITDGTDYITGYLKWDAINNTYEIISLTFPDGDPGQWNTFTDITESPDGNLYLFGNDSTGERRLWIMDITANTLVDTHMTYGYDIRGYARNALLDPRDDTKIIRGIEYGTWPIIDMSQTPPAITTHYTDQDDYSFASWSPDGDLLITPDNYSKRQLIEYEWGTRHDLGYGFRNTRGWLHANNGVIYGIPHHNGMNGAVCWEHWEGYNQIPLNAALSPWLNQSSN